MRNNEYCLCGLRGPTIWCVKIINLKVVFSREGGVWRRQCEEVVFSRADCLGERAMFSRGLLAEEAMFSRGDDV